MGREVSEEELSKENYTPGFTRILIQFLFIWFTFSWPIQFTCGDIRENWPWKKFKRVEVVWGIFSVGERGFSAGEMKLSIEILGGEYFQEKFYTEEGFPAFFEKRLEIRRETSLSSNESRLKIIFQAELSARSFLEEFTAGMELSAGMGILRERNFPRRNFLWGGFSIDKKLTFNWKENDFSLV